MDTLSAAALLEPRGRSILEQRELPDGFAHNWLRPARVREPKAGVQPFLRIYSGVHVISGDGNINVVGPLRPIEKSTAPRRGFTEPVTRAERSILC